MSIQATPRPSRERCPFCRDSLSAPDHETFSCTACGASSHLSCLVEQKGCAACGWGRQPVAAEPVSEAPTPVYTVTVCCQRKAWWIERGMPLADFMCACSVVAQFKEPDLPTPPPARALVTEKSDGKNTWPQAPAVKPRSRSHVRAKLAVFVGCLIAALVAKLGNGNAGEINLSLVMGVGVLLSAIWEWVGSLAGDTEIQSASALDEMQDSAHKNYGPNGPYGSEKRWE